MTIPKATTITYATMPQEGERILIKGHDVLTDGIYVAGISHSVTIEPFKFQSEADRSLFNIPMGAAKSLEDILKEGDK